MSGEQLSTTEQQQFQDDEAAYWAQPEVQEKVAEFRREVALGTIVATDMSELQSILLPESTQA